MSVRRHLLPPLVVAGAGFALLLATESAKWPHRGVLIALGLACLTMARNSLRFGLVLALAMIAVWVTGSTTPR